MRTTKRSNIAIRVLMYCAVHDGRLVTKSEIAAQCNVSESHVAQVINQLAQLGYLSTRRGRNGGLKLGRPQTGIYIGEIFRRIEANVPAQECFADVDRTCPLVGACRLRSVLARAAEAFLAELDRVSLDMLVCANTELEEIMSFPACRQGLQAG